MTTDILNDGLTTTTVDIAAWKAVDKTKYVLIDQKSNDDGSSREALYQSKVGNAEYPKTTRIGSYQSPNANGGVGSRSTSVKVADYLQKTDADLDEVWTGPITVTVAINAIGTEYVPDQTALAAMIQEAASWLIQISAGAVSESALTDLAFGVPSTGLTHVNSASV